MARRRRIFAGPSVSLASIDYGIEFFVETPSGGTVVLDVEKRGERFCVVAKTSGRSMGCYDTKEEAVERLRQVEGHSS